jgi:hypothetical protein
VHRAERLAGVLDDRQAVALQGRRVGRVAEDVHRQQCARAVGDRRRGRRRVEVQRDRVDVHEHRARPLVEHGVRRGDEGERRRHDLLALPHTDRAQRQVQAGRARGHGAGVRHAQPGGERGLEGGHARAERELAGAQDLEHELLLARSDHGPR